MGRIRRLSIIVQDKILAAKSTLKLLDERKRENFWETLEILDQFNFTQLTNLPICSSSYKHTQEFLNFNEL